MPPRLNILGVGRSLAVRTRPSLASRQPPQFLSVSWRGYADNEGPKGPNQDVLGHVSEEAAAIGDITGETKPDLDQGTPVQEIFERDEKAREKAPEVIKEKLDQEASKEETIPDEQSSKDSLTKTSSVESASIESAPDESAPIESSPVEGSSTEGALSESSPDDTPIENMIALQQIAHVSEGGSVEEMELIGHKFGIPELPIPARSNLKYRYDPLVSQVTKLLMKHGKLSKAQRDMAYILNHLRSSPAPKTNPMRPLLPGSPPPTHLPLNPVLYMGVAIDSIAPLLKIKALRGLAGGGASLQLPVPLGLRQRRRQAVNWILDSASKKTDRGSGKYQFAQKVAEELINVVEGKSTAWDKRQALHKLATSNRANLNAVGRKR